MKIFYYTYANGNYAKSSLVMKSESCNAELEAASLRTTQKIIVRKCIALHFSNMLKNWRKS